MGLILRDHGCETPCQSKNNCRHEKVMFYDCGLNHKIQLFRKGVLIPTCIVAGIGTYSCTGLLWYWLLCHRTVDGTAVRNVILCTVS